MTFDEYAKRTALSIQTHAHARGATAEQVISGRGRMVRLACAKFYPNVPGAWDRIQALALGPQVAPFDPAEVAEARTQPVSAEEILGPCPDDPTLARLWRTGVVL